MVRHIDRDLRCRLPRRRHPIQPVGYFLQRVDIAFTRHRRLRYPGGCVGSANRHRQNPPGNTPALKRPVLNRLSGQASTFPTVPGSAVAYFQPVIGIDAQWICKRAECNWGCQAENNPYKFRIKCGVYSWICGE